MVQCFVLMKINRGKPQKERDMSTEDNYPKKYMQFKEVYGYGGVRIYKVTEDEAKEIAKEFPEAFKFKPPFAAPAKGEPLYYMNVNHGEQHVIFSVSEKL